jgi:hypothetical protein
MTIKMYSNDEKTDMIVIYEECNKNASVLGVYEDPKLIVHLTKRMTFMTQFTKLHS